MWFDLLVFQTKQKRRKKSRSEKNGPAAVESAIDEVVTAGVLQQNPMQITKCKSFSTIGQTLGRRTKNMYITNKRKLICSGDISRVQKDTYTQERNVSRSRP